MTAGQYIFRFLFLLVLVPIFCFVPGSVVQAAPTHLIADLLLTDVVMPNMNGKELQERISAIQPDIRLLFMSGYTADIITYRGVLANGANFLQKPFSLTE